MDRNDERNRSSERGRSDESAVNRSGEGSMRERSRTSEDESSREEWSPSGTSEDISDTRTDRGNR